jgi:hypothetical protein
MGDDDTLGFPRRFEADGFDWVTALFLLFVLIQNPPLTSCSLINWLRGVALLLLSLFGESPLATVPGMMSERKLWQEEEWDPVHL